jgi:hypothetical protein
MFGDPDEARKTLFEQTTIRGDIRNRFGYHKPVNDNIARHRMGREMFQDFAKMLDHLLPEGRAKAIAFTELEKCSMWSHKAIAELSPVVDE